MATWVEDIVQALKNLGGQAALSEISAEIANIRTIPLNLTYQATIRERILRNSSDSKSFSEKDIFKKVGKGKWALRDQVQKEPTLDKEPTSIDPSTSALSPAKPNPTQPLPARPITPESISIRPSSTTIPRKPAVQAYLPVES
ncbi:MAG: hypothetical protein WCI88_12640, partial [Chloroflexota bacterium]